MVAGDPAMAAADGGSHVLSSGLGHGHERGVQEWEAGSEERHGRGSRRDRWGGGPLLGLMEDEQRIPRDGARERGRMGERKSEAESERREGARSFLFTRARRVRWRTCKGMREPCGLWHLCAVERRRCS